MFLEVSEREGDRDWSAFVSHRLVIVNQRDEQRSLVKESQVPPPPRAPPAGVSLRKFRRLPTRKGPRKAS